MMLIAKGHNPAPEHRQSLRHGGSAVAHKVIGQAGIDLEQAMQVAGRIGRFSEVREPEAQLARRRVDREAGLAPAPDQGPDGQRGEG